MSYLSEHLESLNEVQGFVAATFGYIYGEKYVDSSSAQYLDWDIDAMFVMSAKALKAQLQAVQTLQLEDSIEDLLITLGPHHYIIRPCPNDPEGFFCLALSCETSNIALARVKLLLLAQETSCM